MTKRVERAGLQVAQVLADFIEILGLGWHWRGR